MDFLNLRDVSFLPDSSIGRLCEDLNNIVGKGVWYDMFQVKNTKWLWLVNDIVTTMNSDKVLCGSFGLYLRAYYDFGCKKPQNCTCAVSYKQPLSLKTAASEIVFGLYTKEKLRFDNKTICKPFEIHEIPEDALLNIILS